MNKEDEMMKVWIDKWCMYKDMNEWIDEKRYEKKNLNW